MFRFNCPNCAKSLKADESCIGKKAKCPGCNSLFTIPPQNIDARNNSKPAMNELLKPSCLDNKFDETVSQQKNYIEQEIKKKEEYRKSLERKRFWLIDIFLYPANFTGLIMIIILAGIPLLVEVLPWIINYLGQGSSITGFLYIVFSCAGLVVVFILALYKYWYFCQCILDSAEGHIRVPTGVSDTPDLGGLFSGVKNIIVCLFIAFAPVIIYGYWTKQLDRYFIFHLLISALPGEVLNKYISMDLTFYLLLGFGIIIFPMSLLSMVMHDSTRGLNPFLILISALKTFPYYIFIVFIFCVFFLMIQYIHYRIYYQGDIFVWAVRRFVTVYFSLIIAHLLGRLYFKNADKLGWLT